ncbi:D-2-hydroxyacid dehydrogenase [Shewanella intestini]|uniref:D-2-hydroxyacid dehydrogenase n=1 Tax=Shewanella intestini TaxID=2017544 RepID=A0ABS5HZ61_9GAMM|nr:D-2-hydroxyacid dehydrogenase [Shewanella sp. XMDDZSB0408]MBR9726415.1 D-2-hydroxyacid dehydrogenase [Shewanella intestini]MRG35019.1 D-2-hydroxyacid dehydrogenase [Shewanella sp. XMDDZSB0408]
MKIVVLDSFTLNPGDLSWQALSQLGNCQIYPHTLPSEVASRAHDADIVLTNKTVLSAQTLASLPKVKYIGVLATGTNVVDLDCAKQRGIVVTNVPGYGPDAVAQMVFAHILAHCQQVNLHDQAVKQGQWTQGRDFCFTLSPLMSLKGKTLGVIGFGDIGQQVAHLALAFGMNVIIHTPKPKQGLGENMRWCELDTLLREADIVSLHCPLTPQTKLFINAKTLSLLKAGALLINTARGDLVNETELALWLNQQRGFAGIDVLSSEPPQADNPLLTAKNITITPHIAWATREARLNLLNIAVENVQAYLKGVPIHCV